MLNSLINAPRDVLLYCVKRLNWRAYIKGAVNYHLLVSLTGDKACPSLTKSANMFHVFRITYEHLNLKSAIKNELYKTKRQDDVFEGICICEGGLQHCRYTDEYFLSGTISPTTRGRYAP